MLSCKYITNQGHLTAGVFYVYEKFRTLLRDYAEIRSFGTSNSSYSFINPRFNFFSFLPLVHLLHNNRFSQGQYLHYILVKQKREKIKAGTVDIPQVGV